MIRAEVARRLHARFSCAVYVPNGAFVSLQCQLQATLSPMAVEQCLERNENGLATLMPGYDDVSFPMALCNAVPRKCESRFNLTPRTVTLDFYSLWFLSSRVMTELFADAFNESGFMESYCSTDPRDDLFSSLGRWQVREKYIEGAGGNPPFEKEFLHEVVSAFDKDARGITPYFRCGLLSRGKSYKLISRIRSLSSKGMLLVRIPPGSLPFRAQEACISYTTSAAYHQFHELGLFIWLNREYIEKYPPPKDVKQL